MNHEMCKILCIHCYCCIFNVRIKLIIYYISGQLYRLILKVDLTLNWRNLSVFAEVSILFLWLSTDCISGFHSRPRCSSSIANATLYHHRVFLSKFLILKILYGTFSSGGWSDSLTPQVFIISMPDFLNFVNQSPF